MHTIRDRVLVNMFKKPNYLSIASDLVGGYNDYSYNYIMQYYFISLDMTIGKNALQGN